MSQPKEFTHCIHGATLEQCVVALDNSSYVKCTLRACLITFAGSDVIQLSGCTLDNSEFRFIGAAKNTLQFLAELYAGQGTRQFVEGVFAAIRGAQPMTTVTDAKDVN